MKSSDIARPIFDCYFSQVSYSQGITQGLFMHYFPEIFFAIHGTIFEIPRPSRISRMFYRVMKYSRSFICPCSLQWDSRFCRDLRRARAYKSYSPAPPATPQAVLPSTLAQRGIQLIFQICDLMISWASFGHNLIQKWVFWSFRWQKRLEKD